MENFKGIMICTDIDGTLLGSDARISAKNLEAIRYFIDKGGIFTFVTGRMPFFVTDIYETVRPNAPIGCINGGGVYDYVSAEYLWTQVMPQSVIELVEYADQNIDGLGIQLNTFDKIYFCKENLAMSEFRRITGMSNLTCPYKEVKEPIAKIVFGDTDVSKITKLQKLLYSHLRADEFDFIRSEEYLYEILPKGISKATALKKLSQILGVDISNTVAVGDYNNDITMLETAGVGIAVANAVPDVKAVADHVTVSNDDDAIAQIIYDIDNGKIIL